MIESQEHTCYCEPFAGAAWVLFRKDPSRVEVLNDADGELISFWRVIQNHLEEFLRYYKFALISRQLFDLANKTNPATLTDIQRAVRYYYVQRNGFGGKIIGRTFGTSASRSPALNLSTIHDVLLETHWRLKGVTIEHLDACECIRRYDRPTTLFYIDPPYYGTTGYAVPFGKPDYLRLRSELLTIKGRFILSLNDVPAVREIYRAFTFKPVTLKYSMANARTCQASREVTRRELLIHNLGAPSDRNRKERVHERRERHEESAG